MTSLMEHLGWSATSFESATESTTDFQAADLCNRKIDAAIYVVAHPNMGVQEALSRCDAVLMPVSIPTAEAFFAENPYFFRADISANAYPSIPNPVPSFGVVATILASSDTPSETVYHVVKAVFENLEEMRTLLPVFANLDRSFMLAPHHSVPWHPGAVKYFKEAGLM
jgi:TRAP transporter TAXI family solute receptor